MFEFKNIRLKLIKIEMSQLYCYKNLNLSFEIFEA